MKLHTKVIVIFLILFICVVSDQVTKKIAVHYLAGSGAVTFLHNTVVLKYAENTGGFLSMGSKISDGIRFWIFSVFVALFLCSMLFYLLFSKSLTKSQIVILSVILGGGFGNLFDRFHNNGKVVDFMNVGIGPVRTGIFNVADLFITFGVIFLVILLVAEGRKNRRENSDSE